jgi:hypothetical protein
VTVRNDGLRWTGPCNTSRLHAAQLDLAAQRWRQARLEADPRADTLDTIRGRIMALKQRQAALVRATPERQPA